MQNILADLFADAVNAIIIRASSNNLGILPTENYTVRWLEAENNTKSILTEESCDEFSYVELSQKLNLFKDPPAPVKKFHEEFEQFSLNHGKFQKNYTAAYQAQQMGQKLLIEYFNKVKKFYCDQAIIKQIIDVYTREIQNKEFTLGIVFLVKNLSADKAFDLADNVQFRHVTKDDIYKFGRVREHDHTYNINSYINTNDWLCICQKTISKDDELGRSYIDKLINNITVCLNLAVKSDAIFYLLRSS
jgi:hypothetical protein